LRVEREVGQLSFDDFAASSDLGGGTINAGNPDLAPEREWVYEGAGEWSLFGRGGLSVTLAHSNVEEVQDLIPLEGAGGVMFEVAGRTTGNTVVNLPGAADLIGRLVRVRITEAAPNSLRGVLAAAPAQEAGA
jgi:hypothetical protein